MLDHLGLPMPDAQGDPAAAARLVSRQLWALARVLLVPVLVVGALAIDGTDPLIWLVVGALVLSSGALLATTSSERTSRFPGALAAPFELALVAGVLACTGGAASPLRFLVVLSPVLAGYLAPWRTVVAIGLAAFCGYGIVAAPDLLDGAAEAGRHAAALGVAVLYGTATGVMFAYGRAVLATRAEGTDAARRQLLNTRLTAEDRERRRVSDSLHADALQVLLAASQDLHEETPDALRRARGGIADAVAALRQTVRDLHPATRRDAGPATALRLALEHRVRLPLSVEVEPGAAGTSEPLLLELARELGDTLAAAGIDEALRVRVARAQERTSLCLRVAEPSRPGVPLAPLLEALAARVAEQHSTLRVERDDGTLTLTVRLPYDGGPGDQEDVQRSAGLLFAGIRLAALPAGLALALIGGDVGAGYLAAFAAALALFGYGLLAAWVPRWGRVPRELVVVSGFVAYAAALAAQGGVATELPLLAPTLPFVLVLAYRPRALLGLGGLLAAALVVASAGPVLDDDPGAREAAAVLGAGLAWSVLTSVLLATARERMRFRLDTLERARRKLLGDSLAAADAERRRLSEHLHDGALQELMIAGQDLDEAIAGNPEARVFAHVALDSAVLQLRDVVGQLHPPALEHGGLRPAVTALLDRVRRGASFRTTTDVSAAADGVRDEFVLALVREFVTNAGRHADADEVRVRVARDGDWLELRVDDDGKGASLERVAGAVAEGHIGLASARERVEADGGELLVDSAPGRGMHVRARIPVVPGRVVREPA